MTVDENLNRIAKNIIKYGEIHNADGCLRPSVYNKSYNDDAIIEKFDVTHYSRVWEELGKSVKLSFYRAEAFGASYPDLNNIVFETVVQL